MARVLRLYANFTPNQSNNTFYMYVNTANYLTKILGHLKQIEIPLDNYRINTGVIKIKKDLIIDFDIKKDYLMPDGKHLNDKGNKELSRILMENIK